MENKNNVAVFSLAFLVAGVFIGWLIWGNMMGYSSQRRGMHEMESGHMMDDGDMDMNSMMEGMTSDLVGKTGDDFDKAFIKGMVVHHEGAVDMAELALKNAKHKEIKDMAGEIIKAQTSEISQMKEWLKVWYGEDL